jgi:hypothetical protein
MSDAVNTAIEVIAFLRNDIHILMECRCQRHGSPGAGPNFTSCLVPLIACETVGDLVAPRGLKGFDRTRAFLADVGKASGDARYATLGGPLWALYRHGLAHQFTPKRLVNMHGTIEVVAACYWVLAEAGATHCFEWLGTAAAEALRSEMRHDHLVSVEVPAPTPRRHFRVYPQLLCLDVDLHLQALALRLEDRSDSLARTVEDNYVAWSKGNDEQRKFTPDELAVLLR